MMGIESAIGNVRCDGDAAAVDADNAPANGEGASFEIRCQKRFYTVGLKFI